MSQVPIPVDPLHFTGCAALALAAGLGLCALRPAWIVRRPRSVLVVLALVSALAAFALVRTDPIGLRLDIDPGSESLLPAGDPGHRAYRRAILDFGDDQVFVVAMEAEDVFDARHLAALRRIGDRISRLDGVRGVTSLVNVTSFRYAPEHDWIEVRPLIEEIPTGPEELAALRARVLGNPLYRHTLVSEDGRGTALEVRFRSMTDGEFISSDLDGAIRAIVESEARDARRFYVSGRPHIKSRMYHAMTRDLASLIPASLAVVALALTLLAGSKRAIALPLTTVATAVLWTFGGIAALGRPLTVLTVLLAPTLVAVGSVYGVHVVSRYEEEARSGGDAHDVALRTLQGMSVPVLIAGVTTAMGFAALLLTDVPAVSEVGAFSVLGVGSVTLVSLAGIPAALALLPVPARAGPGSADRRWPAAFPGPALERGLVALARLGQRRSGAVIGVWGAAALVAAALVPRIDIDTDYLSFFDERAQVRREFERIDALLAGVVPLYLVLEGSESGRLRDPSALRGIERIQRRVDQVPGVSRTHSFVDPLRLLNRAVAGDDPAEERIPDSRPAIAELLFMLPKSELRRFATVDQRSANIVVRTGAVGSAAMRRLVGGIEAALEETGVPAGLQAQVTGNAILLNRAADGVARSQPRTVGMAAIAIFLLLSLALRSARLGLVAMLPNALPVLLFFGVLGSGVAPLSLPTSLIGSVALGIAIDATAHYLVRYREERRAGRDVGEALLRCNRRVGRPIAVASLTLSLGFLSVAVSQFATIREFGVLTAITMSICLFTDLLLLPAILWRIDRGGESKLRSAETD